MCRSTLVASLLPLSALLLSAGSIPVRAVGGAPPASVEEHGNSAAPDHRTRYDFSDARRLLRERDVVSTGELAPALAPSVGELLTGDDRFALPHTCGSRAGSPEVGALRNVPRLRFSERKGASLAWRADWSGSPLASVFGATVLTVRGAVSALPTEYVVDDSGGPGVDFTEISDALAVAQDGDLVTVRVGSYQPFHLHRGVTIIGEEGVTVSSSSVSGVPRGSTAVLALLKVRNLPIGFYHTLTVESCEGTVVLDRLEFPRLEVSQCADVRVHGCATNDAFYARVTLDDSRAEFVDCDVRGGSGDSAICIYDYLALDGEAGIAASGGKLHVARSVVGGGAGGHAECCGPGYKQFEIGGVGGHGIQAVDCYTVVAGEAIHAIRGGPGGWDCPDYAADGVGVSLDSGALRSSGADLPPSHVDNNGGTVVFPKLPDPTLELVGDPQQGAQLTFVLRGNPGGATQLFFSRTPIVSPDGVIEQLIPLDRGVDLGIMPPSGETSFTWTVPWPPTPSGGPVFDARPVPVTGSIASRFRRGTVLFAQGTVLTGGQPIHTNSVPIVIR